MWDKCESKNKTKYRPLGSATAAVWAHSKQIHSVSRFPPPRFTLTMRVEQLSFGKVSLAIFVFGDVGSETLVGCISHGEGRLGDVVGN